MTNLIVFVQPVNLPQLYGFFAVSLLRAIEKWSTQKPHEKSANQTNKGDLPTRCAASREEYSCLAELISIVWKPQLGPPLWIPSFLTIRDVMKNVAFQAFGLFFVPSKLQINRPGRAFVAHW